ncbi:hypothetical protein SESBI_34191 [Sesbania bispinosa]|nr:hypothetical protein SESBI_34191 [Sesbania bispinosa]
MKVSREFSFRERLEGWTIELMQREDGTHDVFYHHTKSRKTFRFIRDIVNFLQYEVYYGKQIKTLQKDSVSKESSTGKRKGKSTSCKDAQKSNTKKSRKRNTSEGGDFLLLAEENATETGDSSLTKVGGSYAELRGDESLEEIIEIFKNAKIDHNEEKCEFPDLHEISMDWSEHDALLDTYYNECDIPICESMGELIEFLETERLKQG